eukprot:3368411-Amphidinium_carterae.1
MTSVPTAMHLDFCSLDVQGLAWCPCQDIISRRDPLPDSLLTRCDPGSEVAADCCRKCLSDKQQVGCST